MAARTDDTRAVEDLACDLLGAAVFREIALYRDELLLRKTRAELLRKAFKGVRMIMKIKRPALIRHLPGDSASNVSRCPENQSESLHACSFSGDLIVKTDCWLSALTKANASCKSATSICSRTGTTSKRSMPLNAYCVN